jgi:hypothetical protein
MMSNRMALKIAIELLHSPSRVRLIRTEPLPDDVLILLRIVAGDDGLESAVALSVDRPKETMRQAATFFIEQILFAPDSDSYRVLGAGAQAGAHELRRNVALLLRWLHPDLDPRDDRSVFVGRVTAAWNDLKTPERRAAYDDQLRISQHTAWRSRGGQSKSSSKKRAQSGNGKTHRVRYGQFANSHRRETAGVGFFRRALSILLQRPPQ